MNSFKKQLNYARREYQQAKYPGDLALDVLADYGSTRRFLPWVIGASAAVAALIAVALFLRIHAENNEIAIKPTQQSTEHLSLELGPMPQFPSVEIAPTYQALSIPSMPTFPSLNEIEPSNTES